MGSTIQLHGLTLGLLIVTTSDTQTFHFYQGSAQYEEIFIQKMYNNNNLSNIFSTKSILKSLETC